MERIMKCINVILAAMFVVCSYTIVIVALFRGLFHPAMLVWVAVAIMATYLFYNLVNKDDDEQE